MAEDGWWLLVGFGGQALFMGRFVLQWFVSERARRSVIPVGFWYLSILGRWCCWYTPCTGATRCSSPARDWGWRSTCATCN